MILQLFTSRDVYATDLLLEHCIEHVYTELLFVEFVLSTWIIYKEVP